MSDPLRTDPPRALDGAPDSGRDAKIEQLLLIGLDHYFAGHYDQAINVWTRVLFLDRSHARARAYIDRARSALAERLRESEELLQNGVAAFARGEGDEARRLIQAAISQGAPSDEALAALAVLDRLNPVEPAPPPAATPSRAARSPVRESTTARRSYSVLRGFGWVVAALLATAAGIVVVGMARFPGVPSVLGHDWRSLALLDMFDRVVPGATAPADRVESRMAPPRRSETALARAHALETSGHLRDALAALDEIRLADPEHAAADRLRADLQRQLITLGDSRRP